MNKYQDALNELCSRCYVESEKCTCHPKYRGGKCNNNCEHRQAIQELVDKETKYQSLEEELGIDLITLFKALKDGIYYNPSNEFFKKPTLYYSNYNNCWCFDLALGTYIVRLKDYKKTWALCREDLENGKL